jgi:hypothetical protein
MLMCDRRGHPAREPTDHWRDVVLPRVRRTTRVVAVLLSGLVLVGSGALSACKPRGPESPNGSCSQTPGQCGYPTK